MQRDAYEVALRQWLVDAWRSVSGMTVVYAPVALNVSAPPRPYATIQAFSVQPEGGDDEVVFRSEPTDAPGTMTVEHRGHYRGTASVNVYADDARGLIRALRLSIHDPFVKERLDATGVVVVRIGAETDVPEQQGTTWFRRRVVDVDFAFAEHELTTVGTLDEINPDPFSLP